MESRNYLQLKGDKNTFYKNPWNQAKVLSREKFIVFNPFIRKQEKLKINELRFQLKKLKQDHKVIKRV